MIERLKELRANALSRIKELKTIQEVEQARLDYLGKKGSLTAILKDLGKLADDARREAGSLANEIKTAISEGIEQAKINIRDNSTILPYKIDITRPGSCPPMGSLHPTTQMCYDLNEQFLSMGFRVFQEDEITSELYAFDKLNFPPDHPARESMDTYWLEGTEELRGAERLALRPHLTGASVRYLKEHGAPARFVYPGRVYRNENTDARHERAFFQYEVLIVDEDFSFASGRQLIDTILEKVFGEKVETRMRAGFFPFVEPGFEIDMRCRVCGGKGCKVCKNVGWIEVMPGGSPHPNVLKAAGLDPDVYSGFYVNIGLDRLVMMRYGVDDVRLFHSSDLRFLNQFD